MLDLKKNVLTPVSEEFYGLLWSVANPLLLENYGDFAAARKKLSETNEVFLFLDGDGKHFVARLSKSNYVKVRDMVRNVKFLDTVRKRFAPELKNKRP